MSDESLVEERAPDQPAPTALVQGPATPTPQGDSRGRSFGALQQLVGNQAVAGLVQRHPGPPGHSHEGEDVGEDVGDFTGPLIEYEPAEDPIAEMGGIELVFYGVNQMGWDEAGQASELPPELFRPAFALIATSNKLIVVDPAGNPFRISDNTHTIGSTANRAYLVQLRTHQGWTLMSRQGAVEEAHAAAYSGELDDDEAVPAQDSMVLIAYPRLVLTDEQITRIERMIRRTEAAVRRASGPPRWSRSAYRRIRNLRGPSSEPEGSEQADSENADEAGPGLGRDGDGSGGGGTSETETGGGGEADTGDGAGAEVSEVVTDPELPLQGEISVSLKMSRSGRPEVEISIEGRKARVRMRRRESDDELNDRIDQAIDDLQQAHDPDLVRPIEDAATSTNFDDARPDEVGRHLDPEEQAEQARESAGRSLPGERLPGNPGIANSPAYPSSITMAGHRAPQAAQTQVMLRQASFLSRAPAEPAAAESAQSAEPSESTEGAVPQREQTSDQAAPSAEQPAPAPTPTIRQDVSAPTTTLGATNRFTMSLDYGAMSYGVRDEVFNRLQPINFYWELLEVPGMTAEQAEARSAQTAVGGEGTHRTRLGQSMDLERSMDDIAEDQQNDLAMMEEENWGWDARAAYLAVIGLSNSIRMIGSLISSFVSLITTPMS